MLFDYQPSEYRQSDLIKLDILLNGEQVDASALIHRASKPLAEKSV